MRCARVSVCARVCMCARGVHLRSSLSFSKVVSMSRFAFSSPAHGTAHAAVPPPSVRSGVLNKDARTASHKLAATNWVHTFGAQDPGVPRKSLCVVPAPRVPAPNVERTEPPSPTPHRAWIRVTQMCTTPRVSKPRWAFEPPRPGLAHGETCGNIWSRRDATRAKSPTARWAYLWCCSCARRSAGVQLRVTWSADHRSPPPPSLPPNQSGHTVRSSSHRHVHMEEQCCDGRKVEVLPRRGARDNL